MAREVSITYYGLIAEKLGLETETTELPEGVVDMKPFLESKHKQLSGLTYSVAVDLTYKDQITSEDTPTKIDVMPPFAGG